MSPLEKSPYYEMKNENSIRICIVKLVLYLKFPLNRLKIGILPLIQKRIADTILYRRQCDIFVIFLR